MIEIINSVGRQQVDEEYLVAIRFHADGNWIEVVVEGKSIVARGLHPLTIRPIVSNAVKIRSTDFSEEKVT